MLIETLKNYGFSEKEARVYLANLEIGNSIVSSIARRANEHRITTYSILKDLKTRGIAFELTKNKVKYFSVIDPKKLLELEEKKVNTLKDALPELMAVSNMFGNKPKVYFYEGIDGLKEVYETMLSDGGDIKAFLGVGAIENKEFLEYAFNSFLPRRVESDIWAKVIVPSSKADQEYKKTDTVNKRETKVIDNTLFDMKNEINVYGDDKIAISLYSEKEVGGLVIQSKNLHDSLESIFDLVWATQK